MKSTKPLNATPLKIEPQTPRYQDGKKKYEAEKRKDPKRGEENTSLAGMTHHFRDRVLAQLSRGAYAPTTDEGVKSCVGELPWWRRDTRGGVYDDDDGYD